MCLCPFCSICIFRPLFLSAQLYQSSPHVSAKTKVRVKHRQRFLVSGKEWIARIGHTPIGRQRDQTRVQQLVCLVLILMQVSDDVKHKRFALRQKTVLLPPANRVAMYTQDGDKLLLGKMLAFAKVCEQCPQRA